MKGKALVVTVLAGFLSMSASADFAQFGPATGWMNVSENDGGSQGAALWGSGWGVPDLQAVTADDQMFNLMPNVNTYTDNPDDAYWRNNGGAGPDGNKWMEALVYREHTLVAGETAATMEFNVGAFTLDSRYTLQAFVKILDPGSGWATTYDDYIDITGEAGTTTLTVDDPAVMADDVLQFGFVMNGLNANPDTDWGGATVTMESLDVVPEPATLGLMGIFGGAMMFLRRRHKA